MKDDSTVTGMDDDTNNIGVLSIDPGLVPFEGHFRYRMRRYNDQMKLFEKFEGGLEEFAKGMI